MLSKKRDRRSLADTPDHGRGASALVGLRGAVAPELRGVVLLPDGRDGRADFVGADALVEHATRVAAGRRDAAQLAVLHRRLADPVDARVAADAVVRRVDHDALVVLVRRVLVDPVRVEQAQAAELAPGALLREVAVLALGLQVGDALVLRLTVGETLRHRLLAVSAADADAVDDEALLRLVAQAARLVRASRARGAVDGGQVAPLPVAHAQQEAQHVGLLLLVHLLHVLVAPHPELTSSPPACYTHNDEPRGTVQSEPEWDDQFSLSPE